MVTRLPSTFFPEIDESMERVYVRLAPGTSLQDAAKKINGMGALLAKELPAGTADLVLTNVGSPGNARSAMTSPNNGPHMGFIRVALRDAEHRHLSQREVADKMREILNKQYPGVEFLQWPGGLVASVFSNGYLAPLVVEVEAESLEELDAKSKAIADVARGVPGVRDIYPSIQLDYPELRVETDRTQAALVDVSARSAAQTTLEATLGNINTPSVWIDGSNGQSYYVVTSYDGRVVDDPNALALSRPTRRRQGNVLLAKTSTSPPAVNGTTIFTGRDGYSSAPFARSATAAMARRQAHPLGASAYPGCSSQSPRQ